MAFCPNCEAEYKPGIAVCSDCNIELVAELSPETRIHDVEQGNPVLLQSFKTSTEADMVSEVLSKNGIRSFVEGGSFAILPSSFSEEIVLMVDERDLVRAIEIYEAYFNKPDSSDNGQDDEQ
jgi:hypothetical protein